MKRSALVAICLVAACAAPVSPTPSLVVPAAGSLTPSVQPTPTMPSVQRTLISPSPSEDAHAFPGVVEVRPDGWSYRIGMEALVGFPNTSGRVYGPDEVAVPPNEGPGRLAFYETFPADEAYLESRIEASRKHGGRAQAVVVNGDAAEVWLDETSGELLLGWTLPGKSEVLVANTADFTVAQLVKSAESVSDCCG
jgi:hypothetical protein